MALSIRPPWRPQLWSCFLSRCPPQSSSPVLQADRDRVSQATFWLPLPPGRKVSVWPRSSLSFCPRCNFTEVQLDGGCKQKRLNQVSCIVLQLEKEYGASISEGDVQRDKMVYLVSSTMDESAFTQENEDLANLTGTSVGWRHPMPFNLGIILVLIPCHVSPMWYTHSIWIWTPM